MTKKTYGILAFGGKLTVILLFLCNCSSSSISGSYYQPYRTMELLENGKYIYEHRVSGKLEEVSEGTWTKQGDNILISSYYVDSLPLTIIQNTPKPFRVNLKLTDTDTLANLFEIYLIVNDQRLPLKQEDDIWVLASNNLLFEKAAIEIRPTRKISSLIDRPLVSESFSITGNEYSLIELSLKWNRFYDMGFKNDTLEYRKGKVYWDRINEKAFKPSKK